MKSLARLREHPWLSVCVVALATVFSVGCSSSRHDSNATSNPLAAYETNTNNSSPETTGTVINGTTVTPGSLTSPVITVNEDGSSSIEGHDNAPLLTNKHAGWQQSSCLTCHNETTNNPDHNYSDDSLCYLCHGTNGMPGLNDTTPPVLSSVSINPTSNSVTISWKSDEPCVSRLVLKTPEGDKMEFPVSTAYTTSHKYTVSGLQPSKTYYYELICTDKSGNKTSSSAFSSAMTFQTNAQQVTPVVTDIDNPSPSEEDITDPFIYGIKAESKGNGQFLLTFSTKEKPDYLNWYLYKPDGSPAYSDNIRLRDDNNYSELCESYVQENGQYTVKVKAIKGTHDPYYSKVYKFTMTN